MDMRGFTRFVPPAHRPVFNEPPCLANSWSSGCTFLIPKVSRHRVSECRNQATGLGNEGLL